MLETTRKTVGRKPKFGRKKQSVLMLQPKPIRIEKWKLFLESRTGRGKKQLKAVMKFIIEKEKGFPERWVPYTVVLEYIREQFSISRSRLTQFMNELERNSMVLRQKKKNLVFYKVDGSALNPVLTYYGLQKEYLRLKRVNNELSNKLVIAESILSEHDLSETYVSTLQQIDEEIEARKVRRKNKSRDEILAEIMNLTPDEMKKRTDDIESAQKSIILEDLKKVKNERNNF